MITIYIIAAVFAGVVAGHWLGVKQGRDEAVSSVDMAVSMHMRTANRLYDENQELRGVIERLKGVKDD